MKRLITAFGITGVFSLVVIAQTPTPPSRPTTTSSAPPATSAPAGGTGAEGKLAFINTSAFYQGINELKVKLDALNADFEPKKKEVQADEEVLNNLKNKIQTQGATVSVQVRAQWMEDAAEKEKLLTRKKEDYNSQGQKRLQEVTQPIQEKIYKFLEQYCQQRNIAMVLEGVAAQQANLLVFFSQATDITDDFMKQYNNANPAATASAPAPASPAGARKP
ncbi:MAG: OmpH family outer membrane protein [Acidobacteria bacterium]|nr:OmpH family outer membrane protein [Acidobacteriota bacterium]